MPTFIRYLTVEYHTVVETRGKWQLAHFHLGLCQMSEWDTDADLMRHTQAVVEQLVARSTKAGQPPPKLAYHGITGNGASNNVEAFTDQRVWSCAAHRLQRCVLTSDARAVDASADLVGRRPRSLPVHSCLVVAANTGVMAKVFDKAYRLVMKCFKDKAVGKYVRCGFAGLCNTS